MKLIAMMAARSESWCLNCTGRAVLAWADEVIFFNHASIDNTLEIMAQIAAEHPGRVTIINEPDPTWNEMNHRQRMLDAVRERGGTHAAYTDADELLCANLLAPGESGQPVIREQIESLAPGRFLQVSMPCMWRSLTRWRNDNSVFGHALTMLAFADSPELGWAPKADGYQFHSREPRNAKKGRGLARDCGGLMHLQFASWRRLVAKHAKYQMDEVLRWPGRKPAHEIARMYSQAPNEVGAYIEAAPAEWTDAYSELFKLVDLDAEPWQEAEVRRLYTEHGPEKFEGLNLFGLVEQREIAA